MCAVELRRNFQMRRGKPDPFGTNVVHMREDCSDGANVAGRFGNPGDRVEIVDQELVHAFICGEDFDGGLAELRVNLL